MLGLHHRKGLTAGVAPLSPRILHITILGAPGCTASESGGGQSWTMEGQSMTPKVTNLVETFLAVTGTCILPCIIRECWPAVPDEIPQQNLRQVRMTIVKHLDKVVTCQLSLIAWDMFAFLEAEEEHW